MSSGIASDTDDDSVVDAQVDLKEDREWQDAENDEEQVTFVSLFDASTFPDLQSMLEHDRTKHGFDLSRHVQTLGVYVFFLSPRPIVVLTAAL